MNNALLFLLPFLMGSGKSDMGDVLAAMMKSNGDANPMNMLLMNMLKSKQKPPETKKHAEPDFDAIKNFSGADITEALKMILQNRV